MSYLVKIIVRFKNSKTAESKAIQRVVDGLGIDGVDVNCAKYYELQINANDGFEAKNKAKIVAGKILANPIIEDFEIQGVELCE